MSYIYRRSLFAVATLFALLAAPPVKGATIVEISGSDENWAHSPLGNQLLVSFSTPVDYLNVSIGVSLIVFGGSGDWNLNAYLTNQVGPGTTALANEIASVSTLVSIPGSGFGPPYTITPYTVFSGLDLAAGDYNLILSGTFETANVWWVGSSNAFSNETENGGAMITRTFASNGGGAVAYLPEGVFTDVEGQNLWFKVTGDPASVSDVPEPSTLALFGIGAMTLGAIRRRRTRQAC